MSFTAPPEAYDRFMGRYSRLLGPEFAAFAGIAPGLRVADVGCGPGALTEVLGGLVGPDAVAAADPSAGFVRACAARVPGCDAREAPAEALPWEDGAFDAALSQLVVNFLTDPAAGAGQMRRVVRPGGTVAASVWDADGGQGMLAAYWRSAVEVGAASAPEALRFGREDELRALWEQAGLADIETRPIDVDATFADFDDFWEPFTYGVGPAGAHCASLDPATRDAVRDACRRRLGDPAAPFTLRGRAWAARGTVPAGPN